MKHYTDRGPCRLVLGAARDLWPPHGSDAALPTDINAGAIKLHLSDGWVGERRTCVTHHWDVHVNWLGGGCFLRAMCVC